MKHFGKRQLFRARLEQPSTFLRERARIAAPGQGRRALSMLPFFIAENTHFQSPERETAAAKPEGTLATKFPIRERGCCMRLLYNDRAFGS